MVQKGTKYGINTLYAQQTLLMEQEQLAQRNASSPIKCPRKAAIKELSTLLSDLQDQDHSIILLIDANQTPVESKTSSGVSPLSIEWLRIEHDLKDPFFNSLVEGLNHHH